VRVLIAPDSFKGSLGAAAVAAALAGGWLSVRPGDQVTPLPLADGGEGTLDVLAATVPGARWHRAKVTGPGGAPVTARWLELPALQGRGDGAARASTAVVELARASGLPLLARPDPMGAHTIGLGELLSRALDGGMGRILVGLGGSASTDGGTGALAALGARFLDAGGEPLPPGGGALADLVSVDLPHLRAPPGGGVTCLPDVTAPLLGARGAAELGRLAGLDRELTGADLVITGEGRFDETSLTGKTCGTVIAAAGAAGVPVAVVAGQASDGVSAREPGLDGVPGLTAVLTLAGLAGGTAGALASPRRWLRRAAGRLASDIGAESSPGQPENYLA